MILKNISLIAPSIYTKVLVKVKRDSKTETLKLKSNRPTSFIRRTLIIIWANSPRFDDCCCCCPAWRFPLQPGSPIDWWLWTTTASDSPPHHHYPHHHPPACFGFWTCNQSPPPSFGAWWWYSTPVHSIQTLHHPFHPLCVSFFVGGPSSTAHLILVPRHSPT